MKAPDVGPNRRALLAGLGAAAAPGVGLAAPRALRLEREMLGSPLVMEGDRGFAGAVSSLRFRGVEYLDRSDHGRLMQTAVQFNGLLECYNPTQAGASEDRGRSSSRLLAQRITPAAWAVSTRMAYWIGPGGRCAIPGVGPQPTANRERLSSTVVDVAHRFGALPAPNAVETALTVRTDVPHSGAVIEALCAYVPTRFERLHTFAAGGLNPAEPAYDGPQPFVASTADGAHAISLFKPASGGGLSPTFSGLRFGLEVNKVNVVFRPPGVLPAGAHAFGVAWAIGTLEEVRAALAACGA